MTLLTLGVALWWVAHLFKRIAPGLRAALGEGPGKGIVALALLGSVVLMVIGYRSVETPARLYTPPDWGRHLNNLAMYVAIVLFGMGSSTGRMRTWLRHPMLTGFALWALSHLLVRGDTASAVLFGGLGLWAVISIPLISARQGPWTRPEPGPVVGDIRLLVIAAALYAVIVLIHWQIFGLYPFPG